MAKIENFEVLTDHFGIDIEKVAKLSPQAQHGIGVGLALAVKNTLTEAKDIDIQRLAEGFVAYVNEPR